jgi:hypothetical protein
MNQSQRAERVRDALDRIVGALIAGYSTIIMWQKHEERHANISLMRKAALHGIVMSYGIIGVTLRKFEDLWTHHIRELFPQVSEAHVHAEWVLEECRRRNLRKTTNLVFAHYAAGKSDWPLASDEAVELLFSGNWTSDEDLVEWTEAVTDRLISIRDEVMRHFNLARLVTE